MSSSAYAGGGALRRSAIPGDARAALVAAATAVAVGTGWIVVERPELVRALVAVAFVGAVLAAAPRWPAASAIATLLALPAEALVRRLLTATAGETTYDPLILVGPVVAVVLCYALFVGRRRRLMTDALSKAILAFLVLALVQVGNPAGGGPIIEFGGLLFLAAPLLWFFLGRELCDVRIARLALGGMVVVGAVVAVYGLWQTHIALPSWDRAWVQASGYDALQVDYALRPFGTFSSNAEYALWLAGAAAVAWALVLHGRSGELLILPVLAIALFYASVRSALLLGVLALFVVAGLRSRRLPITVAVVLSGLAISYAGVRLYGEAASSSAAALGNPLVARQVGGIADPLDARQSTLLLHFDMVVEGVRRGVADPLGTGPAATSLAGSRLGETIGGSTEVDVSNAFVSLGLPGGLLFLGILVLSFRGVIRRYLRGEPLALAVVALLVVMLGQWLTGGLYALLPLFWFLVGWASRP